MRAPKKDPRYEIDNQLQTRYDELIDRDQGRTMQTHRFRLLASGALALLFSVVTCNVLGAQFKPRVVSIIPGIASHGCTPCYSIIKRCKPCNTNYSHDGKVLRVSSDKVMSQDDPTYVARVSNFNCIEADGNVRLTVKQGKSQEVRVSNNGSCGRYLVRVYGSGGVLYLKDQTKDSLGRVKHPPANVEITTPTLATITMHGSSSINVVNLNSDHMIINSDTAGSIRLRGNVKMHQINAYGHGSMDIGGINADHLHIRTAGASRVRVAGNVGMLEVKAIQESHVDARFMTADNALVKTTERAEVDVYVVDALSGFARGFSNIYFFRTPLHLTKHTYQSGNVMQLHHWS